MEKCMYCNENIPDHVGFHTSLTKFCSEACRVNYHNDVRKIERKRQRYYSIIGELLDMRDNAPGDAIKELLNETISDLGAEISPLFFLDDQTS